MFVLHCLWTQEASPEFEWNEQIKSASSGYLLFSVMKMQQMPPALLWKRYVQMSNALYLHVMTLCYCLRMHCCIIHKIRCCAWSEHHALQELQHIVDKCIQQRHNSLPAIALVIQLLITLLAIVLSGACWVEQVFASDEVYPRTDLHCTGKREWDLQQQLAFATDALDTCQHWQSVFEPWLQILQASAYIHETYCSGVLMKRQHFHVRPLQLERAGKTLSSVSKTVCRK